MISLHEQSDGQVLEASMGDVFEIVLPENPTTGFRWRIESSGEPVCRLVRDSFVPPEQAVPGRGGVHHWEFQVERAGKGTILLVLVRSWQPPGPESRTFRTDVHVAKR